MEKKCSVGIRIFSIIGLLYVSFFHLIPLFYYARMNNFIHLIFLAFSIILIISLIFMLKMKNWARIVFVSLMIIQCLSVFPTIIEDFRK